MMEGIAKEDDFVKESFVNIITLSKYCKYHQVIYDSIHQVWKSIIDAFIIEMKDDPYGLLTKGIHQLLDNKDSSQCKPVEAMSHFYFACRYGLLG